MKKLIAILCIIIVLNGYSVEEKKLCKNMDISEFDKKNEIIQAEITVMFHSEVSSTQIEKIVNRLDCKIAYESPFLGFYKILISENDTVEEMVKLFSQESIVKFAEPNTIAHAMWTPNDEYFPYQWHFDVNHLNMAAAWDIEQGGDQDVIVAVIDSGVAYENYQIPTYEQSEVTSNDNMYHRAPDLCNTNFIDGYDFVHNDSHPNDQNSHGTHCAGTIAQSTNNGSGVTGMAFNTTILPVQVLDCNGSGSTQCIADGVAYAVQQGADVLSMSLGGAPGDPTGWEVVQTALQMAIANDVVPIIAAGNGNCGVLSYPAGFDECISVGSTDYDNDLAPYSQYGAGLEVVAPGGNTSEDLNGDSYIDGVLQNTFSDGTMEAPHNVSQFDYLFYQGTSMATPHVAGLAALIIANGTTGYQNVRSAICETATDIGTAGYDQVYGYGMINPVAALQWSGGSGNETVLMDESFEAGNAPNWLSIDNDNDGYCWTVFSESQNPDFDLAQDGDYGIGVQYNTNGNDDWLISPPINLANGETILSFYARSHSSEYLEDFNVKISTTDANLGSFTSTIGTVQNASSSWQQYSYNITAYQGQTIYFAIQCVSVDDWYLFADHFRLTQLTTEATETICSNTMKLSNYPNPFNPTTTISFFLETTTSYRLDIFNIAGQKVMTYRSDDTIAGWHSHQWDGFDLYGNKVSNGVYFSCLKTGKERITKKMLLLK